MIELQLLTKKLKGELASLKRKLESDEGKKNERDRHYFEYVKADSSFLFELIEQWYELTVKFIDHHKSSIYEKQVRATKENFELLILHSYYKDVRKRRYIELNRSCRYVFDQLLKELESN